MLQSTTSLPPRSNSAVLPATETVLNSEDFENSPVAWPADREPSVERAYVLGTYQSTSRRDGASVRVSFYHEDPSVMARICFSLECLGLRKPPKDSAAVPRVVEVHVPETAEYLREVTQDNTKLPWHFLGSKAERHAYVQAFLAHSGSFSGKFFMLQSSRGERLMVEFACLLGEMGVAPTLCATGRGTLLQLSAVEELGALARLEVLTGTKAERLQEILRDAGEGELVSWREKYMQAMEMRETHTSAEIAETLELKAGTVRSWLRGPAVPKSVYRLQEIDRLRKTWSIPQAETLSFLYLERGIPLDVAYELSAKLPSSIVRRHIDRVMSACSNVAFEHLAGRMLDLMDRCERGMALPL